MYRNTKRLFAILATVVFTFLVAFGVTAKAAGSDVVTVTNTGGAPLYNGVNGQAISGRSLGFNTGWKFGQHLVASGGEHFYQVSTNEWAKDTDVATNIVSVVKENGVVTVKSGVTSKPSVNVASRPAGTSLASGTAWRYDTKAKDTWGNYWYRVAVAQWVPDTQVYSESAWQVPVKKNRGSFATAQKFGNTRYGWSHVFHDGIDFGDADWGSDKIVRAVHSGTIVFAGNPNTAASGLGSLGSFVIVLQTDDGYSVIYQEFAVSNYYQVRTGQRVNAGDVIGRLQSGAYDNNTGSSINHLHLGITRGNWVAAQRYAFTDNGTWLNPNNFLHVF